MPQFDVQNAHLVHALKYLPTTTVVWVKQSVRCVCVCVCVCVDNTRRPSFTARWYASAVLAIALCLSVRPSVTSRCSTKTAKRRITQTTPHDTPGSSFLMPKISAKFDRGQPLRGRQMQVGWVKIGDFRQIAGYISKMVKDRHIVSIKVE